MKLDINASTQETLNRLLNNPNIYQIPSNPKLKQRILDEGGYTPDQGKLLTTDAPFVIGTAGAGCGKTHTLVGRLKYLSQLGVPMENILNLSFSNAAVNNLKARFPNAGVSTIASLCQELYHLNFNQSGKMNFYPLTFLNSIRYLSVNTNCTYTDDSDFPNNLVNVNGYEVEQVRLRLVEAYRQCHLARTYDNKVFTSNLFDIVNEHFHAVNIILKQIHQTETALSEIMIHKVLTESYANFKWPDSLKNADIITLDECQDTSTIEMLLMLEIANAKNAQLYLVGDANQTLFEWRSADPEMVGVLQNHDAFTNLSLDVNFRSKPAILFYANVILKRLTTNQIDPIQLHDLEGSKVTLADFQNANTISVNDGFNDQKTIEWIDDCIQKHEQVAILSTSTRVTEKFMVQFKLNYSKPFTSIVTTNESKAPIDYISATIIAAAPVLKEMVNINYGQNILGNYYSTLASTVNTFDLDTAKDYDSVDVLNYLRQAIDAVAEVPIVKQYIIEYVEGKRSTIQVLGLLNSMMLAEEININDDIQAEVQEHNKKLQDEDWSEYDILISTIHSAKGLEYDHVLVIYDETTYYGSKGADQGSLRALGVALTRAKKTQHVLEIVPAVDLNKRDFHEDMQNMKFGKKPLLFAYQLALDYLKNNQNQTQQPTKNHIAEMKKRRPLPFIVK